MNNSNQNKYASDLSSDQSVGFRTPQSNKNSFNRTNSPATTPNFYKKKAQDKKGSKTSIFLVPIIGIIGVVTAFYGDLLKAAQETNGVIYDELEFSTDLNSLGRKYQVDDDSILQVQAGKYIILLSYYYNIHTQNKTGTVLHSFFGSFSYLYK